MWQPGQSGNVNGRPVGSRQAFSAGFLKDLAEVWQAEGRGHYEQAITLYDPAAPHSLETRFGQDLGIALLTYRSSI